MQDQEKENLYNETDKTYLDYRCKHYGEYGIYYLKVKVCAYSVKEDKVYGYIENQSLPDDSEYGSISLADENYEWYAY
jgi:hypothetical protein